jgi:phage shock protein PspC (stress-responsive transcriptional regulator)
MNKVTTINLNGRAYQIEEAGYEALRKYLDQASAKLKDNPDQTEIMADFEQAIADKCDAHLSPRKNVVTEAEVEEIISAMGPVEASDEKGEHTSTSASSTSAQTSSVSSPKRLYRIVQGEWITGVCTGLAAYFGLDVTLIRVLFVLLTVISHGFGVLAYIIFIIAMPVARTDDELAAAHGTKPFNAHDFIEQARSRYAEFQEKFGNMPPMPEKPPVGADRAAWQKWKQDLKDWKQQWKQHRKTEIRQERQARRDERHANRHQGWENRPWQNNSWQNDPTMSAGAGFFRFLMGLVIAALTVVWIFALWTIVQNHKILGYPLLIGPLGHPLWVPIVFICALYIIVVTPFKFMMKNSRPAPWNNYSFFNDVMLSIFFLFALYLAVWLGRELFPIVNAAYGIVAGYLHTIRV